MVGFWNSGALGAHELGAGGEDLQDEIQSGTDDYFDLRHDARKERSDDREGEGERECASHIA